MPFPKSVRTLFVFAAVLLLCQIPIFIDSADAVSGDILISEVHPKEEYFVLSNGTVSDIDLKGYRITDGEGTLEVIRSLTVPAGGSITIRGGETPDYALVYSDARFSKSGSLLLADSGDELQILNGRTVVDCICWGKSKGADGWSSGPVQSSSGYYLLRNSFSDTDTSEDWKQTKPGWTKLDVPDSAFYAKILPFSFPESHGEPILAALSAAETRIDISIYLLSSPDIISVLCKKALQGVSVRVLVEGSPLGTNISYEVSLLKSLSEAGGHVRLINHPDSSFVRYLYLHSKYAVIDNSRIIITSENWTTGNIGDNGNRGWGAIADSAGLAGYFERVFDNDFSMEWGDVSEFGYLYPNARAARDLPEPREYGMAGAWYDASILPVFSPDDSYCGLRGLIGGAEERVYAEQMDLASSMAVRSGDTPVAWMNSAAERGVDTRLVLDTSQSDGADHEIIVSEISSSTSVKAVGISGRAEFSLVHNKGLVCDDSVWIGSVNWTANSFFRNRESAIIIISTEVADYYADLFLRDFGVNYYTLEETGLELQMERVGTSQGEMLVLSVNGPDGAEYEWDLGNGMIRTGFLNRTLFRLPGPGTYTVTVSIAGTDYSCSATYTVDGDKNGYLAHLTSDYIFAAVSVLAAGIAVAILHRRERPVVRGNMYR